MGKRRFEVPSSDIIKSDHLSPDEKTGNVEMRFCPAHESGSRQDRIDQLDECRETHNIMGIHTDSTQGLGGVDWGYRKAAGQGIRVSRSQLCEEDKIAYDEASRSAWMGIDSIRRSIRIAKERGRDELVCALRSLMDTWFPGTDPDE